MSEIDKARDKAYRRYSDRVQRYRTTIIESAAGLEVQLEWVISSFFSRGGEEYALFNYMFFHDMEIGLSDKIDMFEKLVKTKLKDFHDRHPETVNSLHRVRKLRNAFAHGEATIPHNENRIEKSIIFELAEKGEGKEVDYTFEYINQVVKEGKELNHVLADLIRQFKHSNGIMRDQFKKMK